MVHQYRRGLAYNLPPPRPSSTLDLSRDLSHFSPMNTPSEGLGDADLIDGRPPSWDSEAAPQAAEASAASKFYAFQTVNRLGF